MNMNDLSISIITPVYNAQSNILNCIQKVGNQTFKNYEHIIIDGGSKDNTILIIKENLNKYENLKFISEDDKGVYDAMNKAIILAKSDWIFFLGSDDQFIDDNTLNDISEYLNDQNNEMIYGNVLSKKLNKLYDGKFDTVRLMTKNICHQSIFYNKNIFKKIGKYNLNYKIHADYDLNLRIVLSGSIKIKYINKIISIYEQGGISDLEKDLQFKKEYFNILTNETLKGNHFNIKKSYFIFTIIRKALLRNSIIQLKPYLKNNKFIYHLLFIIILFPFFLITNIVNILSINFSNFKYKKSLQIIKN